MNDTWEVRDLPEPPAYNFRNLIKTIGPGAVLLASSIGGGEWLRQCGYDDYDLIRQLCYYDRRDDM